MRLNELFEYSTKTGQDIEFTYQEDTERINRGWVVHKLTAFIDGNEAGYLKMSYIPRENFEKYYSSILNYFSVMGSHVQPYQDAYEPYNTLDDGGLDETIDGLNRKLHGTFRPPEIEIPAKRDEKLQMIADMINQLPKETHKKYHDFEKFHVDRPLVDFIQVAPYGTSPDREPKPGEDDYRRNGVGTALYFEGAKRMAEKGMHLHASGTQTGVAQNAWSSFAKRGLVTQNGDRRYLDVTKIPKK